MRNRIVGIIGVGLMGQGIAINIQKCGWQLNFLEHEDNQPTNCLLESGAKSYCTGQELAAESDVIILCVTGCREVEEVLTRHDGVLKGLKTGSVIIDCSTSLPETTRKLANQISRQGGHFMDAPMTRTPKEAAEGRLNLIVGGDRSLFDDNLSLLESFSEHITYAGETGMGHRLKLLHNFVSLGFSAILAEAAASSNRAGIDPDILCDVLEKGGGKSVILERMRPYILNEDPSSFAFSLSNCHKDVSYYKKMCEEIGAPQSLAEAVSDLFLSQIDSGHENKYIPELVTLFNKS